MSVPESFPARPQIEKLLTSWRDVCARYCAAFEWDQAPWFYTERPAIGTLSAAAWLAGGIALEEFKTDRVREKKKGRGRCDLYFGMPEGPRYVHFDAEAKHCWVKLHEPMKEGSRRIDECIKKARKAAKTLPKNNPADLRVAIAFVVFCARKNYDPKKGVHQSWITKLKAIAKQRNAAVAWFFLKQNHPTCPGAAVIIKTAPAAR